MQSMIFPDGFERLMHHWMKDNQVGVRLVRPRKTKSGDFRPPRYGFSSRITLNSDLSPVDMMITFCHEWAHYLVYKEYKQRARPHGAEWGKASSSAKSPNTRGPTSTSSPSSENGAERSRTSSITTSKTRSHAPSSWPQRPTNPPSSASREPSSPPP